MRLGDAAQGGCEIKRGSVKAIRVIVESLQVVSL
jgi:hypothetical protein